MSATLGSEAQARLELYLHELRTASARINLVGSATPAALARHVADSLEPAVHLPKGSRVVDLGSGAGFPGIPVAIARPDVEVTLVEIRERRAHFLRHVVRTLELGCRVLRARIEAPSERFGFALARALAPPERALALALPWLEASGEAWIWCSGAELEGGTASAIPLSSGGRVLRIHAAAVPRGTHDRP